MAVVALKCPSCDGKIEFDDSREFGFCSFCGTKVMIQDEIQKIKVIHTGSVVVDDSGKIGNYLSLADSAMKNRNFEEAYNYYTKVLESNATLPDAVFGKGLAAAYMSSIDVPRINELFNAIDCIKDKMPPVGDGVDFRLKMQKNSVVFATEFFNRCCLNEYMNSDIAGAHFFCCDRCIALIVYALDLLDNAALSRNKQAEAYCAESVKLALNLCSEAQTSVKYLMGYEGVKDKNGNIKSVPVYKKLASPYEKEIKGYIVNLKNKYNNLPSTLSEISRYDSEISKNRAIIDDYEKSLSAYFAVNPEDEKIYRHPGLFGAKKKRAVIEAKFSNELLAKKESASDSKEQISELTKCKKRFISQNTI